MAEPVQQNTENPVILSDEEQAAALEQSKTKLTEQEIATQALSTQEKEAKTVAELPTKDGIPRISIAPVTAEPRANIDKTTTRVNVSSKAPYIRTTTTELKPEVESEVTRRAEMQEPLTYDSVMQKLEAGDTVTLGDKVYHPAIRNIIKNTPKERMLLKGQVAQFGKPESPDEPSIMFTDPAATKVVLPPSMTDPDMRDNATEYAEGRIKVNDMLKQTIPDRNVRQIVVDNYISGDFFQNLAQRVAEQGRAIPGLGTLLSEAYGALEALEDTRPNTGTQPGKGLSFSDAWEARRPERENRRQKYLEGVDNVLSGPTLAMHFNNQINRIAKERFEAGTLTEEQYEELAFMEVGDEKVARQHFDEDTAYQLMDLAFNEMPEELQIATIVTENVLTGGFFGATRVARSKDELAKLKKLISADKTLEGLDYNDAIRVLRERDTRIKLNDKLLEVGIGYEQVSDQIKSAGSAIVASTQKLEKMKLDGLGNTTAYKLELSNRDNLQRLRNRAFLTGKGHPLLVAGGVDAFLASGAQFAAREVLGDTMDPGAAEALGFVGATMTGATRLTKFVVGKAATGTKALAGFSGRNALRAMPMMLGSNVTLIGRLANRAIPLGDTTVNDYERLVFKPMNGRNMTLAERSAMRKTVKQVERLTPENRTRLYESIERVDELTDTILEGFPDEASKMEARKLFNMTLGQAAGISVTAAARAQGSLELKNVNKLGLNAIYDATEQQGLQIEQTKAALEAFANHVSKFPQVGQKAPVKRMLSGMQNMILEQEDKLRRDYRDLDENLDTFIEAASADILDGVDENFINDLRNMKVKLKKELKQVITDEQAMKEVNRAWAKGTARRLDRIEALRNNRLRHRAATSRMLESLAYARLNQLTARGDAAYSDLNKFIAETNRPGLDISEAIQEMMDIAGESDIMRMFGREGYFFSSPVGKRAQQVFDNMADKAFKSIDPEFKASLEAGLIEGGMSPQAVADLSNIDFALAAHATGEFNIFGKVTLTEADIMRRAFRDYGYKVQKTNPAVGGRFKEFATKLDNIIKEQDGEGYENLLVARDKYATAVGDTTREGGTFYKLKQSRKGGEKKVLTENAPTMYYYRSFTPNDMFGDITNPLDKIMRGNVRTKEEAFDDLQQAVAETAQAFADPINGELVFNLDDPDVYENFMLIRRAVTESVQGRWFDDFIKSVRKERVGGRVQPEDTYDFTRNESIEVLNNASEITVIQNGVRKRVPLIDLDNLYKFERFQLSNLEEGTVLAKGFKDWQVRGAQILQRVKNAEKDSSIARGNAMINLKILGKVDNAEQFFDRYIDGLGEDISVLRTSFLNTAKDQGVKRKDAVKLFDEGIKAMTFQGLLARGGYGVSGAAVDKAFDGTEYAAKTLNDTSNLLETLNRREVRENLENIFDPEHVDYINAVASHLHIQAARNLVLTGGVKGISTSEALSRAYNIARGMVSPLYVGSEVAIRIMQEMNAQTLFMALDSKDSARIMRNMLKFPKLVTKADLNAFDEMLITFMATHAVRTGQEATVRKYLDINPFDEEQEDDETDTQGQ